MFVLLISETYLVLLTQADGRQQSQAVFWREAGGEQRLQHIVGERQSDHGLVGRVDDQHGDPQTQEPERKRKEVGRLEKQKHGSNSGSQDEIQRVIAVTVEIHHSTIQHIHAAHPSIHSLLFLANVNRTSLLFFHSLL